MLAIGTVVVIKYHSLGARKHTRYAGMLGTITNYSGIPEYPYEVEVSLPRARDAVRWWLAEHEIYPFNVGLLPVENL